MTTPPQPAPPQYLVEDHADRRLAARLAIEAAADSLDSFEEKADRIYAWLRAPFIPHHLVITPGVPQDRAPSLPEGAAP